MPLFLVKLIEKLNGRESRGQPLSPLRRLSHDTQSVSRIVCRSARMVIGDACPEIPSIMEDMVP